MSSPLNQFHHINPEQEQRIKQIRYAKLEAVSNQIKQLECLELFEQPISPSFLGFSISPDNFPSPQNSLNQNFNRQSPGYMQQPTLHNFMQQGALYNLTHQAAMNMNMQQAAMNTNTQQSDINMSMQQSDTHIQQLVNQNSIILQQLDFQQKSIDFLIKELKNTRDDLANFQQQFNKKKDKKIKEKNEVIEVDNETDKKNEQIEVVIKEADKKNEEFEVVIKEANKKNEEIEVVIKETNKKNDEIELVIEETNNKNDEIEVELLAQIFINDETKAFESFEKYKEVQQSNKDLRICYFNTSFEISKYNIKNCIDDIKDGFKKSYNEDDCYILIETEIKNIFLIAINNNEELYDVFVSDWWTTKNIQDINEKTRTTIINTLPPIIPRLNIKNPEGQKIVVCYIENQGSSQERYNFIRLYVSNQNPKADYNI